MAVYSDEKIDFFQRIRHDHNFYMPVSHFHSRNELYYLEKGETRYCIDGEIYFLKPGDLIFVPKEAPHQTSSQNTTQVERLLFVFDDDFTGDYATPWLDELKRNKIVHFPPDKQYRLTEIFHKIEREEQCREQGYLDLQRACLIEMLVTIARFRLRDDPVQTSESCRLIQDAARYIAANADADLSLSALAEKYAVSKSYFSRRFKHVTGISLCEYINMARVSAAEKLLRGGNITVTEAAIRSGFNDSNYFATVFKRLKGTTPKKFLLSCGMDT